MLVHVEAVGSRDLQDNLLRVRAGGDDVVGFKLALIPVVDQVDARIDFAVLHAAELGNVTMPLGRVVADEIVAAARLRIEAFR